MTPTSPPPFAPFEWMIAWRYLRAKRADGGVSVMTWISFIGITLAVFALIATLAVRSGFRAEFVDTILGANAHITLYQTPQMTETGQLDGQIYDYETRAKEVAQIKGVSRVAPLVKGQVMASAQGRNTGVEVFGIQLADLRAIPRIGQTKTALGNLDNFGPSIAIGSGVARELGLTVGDRVRLVSPDGAKTAFGTSPRVKTYEIGYVFTAGRYDIDRTRIYIPFVEAQAYFNRGQSADELEVIVDKPEKLQPVIAQMWSILGAPMQIWTWQDASGNFLRALEIEDNVMFIIMAILVLIAAMNIVSGLIMLVKNKGRDIGILRTMGLSEGTILRVFFLCGAFTGLLGTLCGVVLGCLFAIYIDTVFSLVNFVSGGGVWDPSIRGLYSVPAKLEWQDVFSAVTLSLGLSFGVTYFPARRAARLNPVEALRYE